MILTIIFLVLALLYSFLLGLIYFKGKVHSKVTYFGRDENGKFNGKNYVYTYYEVGLGNWGVGLEPTFYLTLMFWVLTIVGIIIINH